MSIISEAKAVYEKAVQEASSSAWDAKQAADYLVRIQIEARQRALELAIGAMPQANTSGAKNEAHSLTLERAQAFYDFLTGNSPSHK